MKWLRRNLGLAMIVAYALALPAAASLRAEKEAFIAMSIVFVCAFWLLASDERRSRIAAERRATEAEEALRGRRRPRRPPWLSVLPGGKSTPPDGRNGRS